MAEDPLVRCDVIFRGRVQGVGFRHTTTVVAKPYPINGYVMNLRDGSVRMVAEGSRATVSEVIRRVVDAMEGYVEDKTETWGTATGEFSDFGVRYEGR
jgi:acylphosphatase